MLKIHISLNIMFTDYSIKSFIVTDVFLVFICSKSLVLYPLLERRVIELRFSIPCLQKYVCGKKN